MKTIIFFLLLSSQITAQWTYVSSIDSITKIGTPVQITQYEIPVAVWADTVSDLTLLQFEVLFGDPNDATEEDWRFLSEVDDSTMWSARLKDDRITPIDYDVMKCLLYRDRSPIATKDKQVWIRPKLITAQDIDIDLYIRFRYML